MKRNIIPDVISGEQALCTLPTSATAKQAADLMAERHIGAVLIMDHGNLAGIVTERDVVTRLVSLGGDPSTTSVSSIMTPSPTTVAPDIFADIKERGRQTCRAYSRTSDAESGNNRRPRRVWMRRRSASLQLLSDAHASRCKLRLAVSSRASQTKPGRSYREAL